MADGDNPQLYLITPPDFELAAFRPELERVLDAAPFACIRLSLATHDEDRLARAGDMVRDVAHSRDIALVIERHWSLADKLGLDGVHLMDGARSVRAARKALGRERIVGAFCGASRHDGMAAGEAGADYVAFGPLAAGNLGDGASAPLDLFEWWSEMIEVPVVAEGAISTEASRHLAPATDFIAFGEEIWTAEDPVLSLRAFLEAGELEPS
ncbi:MAG: thiamine phosphate synthase [Pseudomonadota bacterium]